MLVTHIFPRVSISLLVGAYRPAERFPAALNILLTFVDRATHKLAKPLAATF